MLSGISDIMDKMTDIRQLGEFGLIGKIQEIFSGAHFSGQEGVLGIGDDCAVIPMGVADLSDTVPADCDSSPTVGTATAEGRATAQGNARDNVRDNAQVTVDQMAAADLLVTTDLLVENVHFLRSDADPWQVGWKSVAVNISDIAAMGGRPVGTFLSIALPKDLPADWALKFTEGYKAISERYDVPLLGGDTTSSLKDICINVAVIGICPHGSAKLRSTACKGDLICVTGTLGDSGGGLGFVLNAASSVKPNCENTAELDCNTDGFETQSTANNRDSAPTLDGLNAHLTAGQAETYLRARHYMPTPRVPEGLILREIDGVHAMMDVSDGIASDLRHILKASKVGAEIDIESLPISDELKTASAGKGWNPVRLALTAGEDYELLFTCTPEALKEIKAEIKVTPIGRIIASDMPEITYMKGGEKSAEDFMGFTHF